MTRSNSNTRNGPAPGGDVRRLIADLGDMVGARRELAELEIRSDVATSKRLAWRGGIGAVLVLVGLPVLVVFLAQLFQSWWPVGSSSINVWAPILAGILMFVGLILLRVAYSRFRQDFLGMRQSLAEFREDLQWLREWTGAGDDSRDE